MSPRNVYRNFEKLFPEMVEQYLEEWFSYGKNSIRLKLVTREEFIFTYGGESDWDLQTINHFFKKMKEGDKQR